jgi:hypothetical protein
MKTEIFKALNGLQQIVGHSLPAMQALSDNN